MADARAAWALVELGECWGRAEEVVALLNEEWPRSTASRRVSLERCRAPGLPLSLLLLRHHTLIGHAKLCSIPGKPSDAWIESVVISKALRGQGLGKILMEMAEEEARKQGFTTLVLSTHDQQKFYQRCGYSMCEPVCVMGASGGLLEGPRFAQLRDRLMGDLPTPPPPSPSPLTSSPAPSLPPPPPPPPPPNPTRPLIVKLDPGTGPVQFMSKQLHAPNHTSS